MSTRIPGDLNGDNILDQTDVGLYDDFIKDNNARTVMAVDTETHQVVMLDAINGGLSAEQCVAVSVHQNGYASYIDRMLVDQYFNLPEPRPATLTDYINQLDSATIVPPVDPSVNTLQELRDDVTNNIRGLFIYQADVMLKEQKMAAQSINDMRAKCEHLWSDAFIMDYNTIYKLDSDMQTGIQTADDHGQDSSWRQTTSTVLETMRSVIMNPNVTKAQLEEMRDRYGLTGSTFSDPPTDTERSSFAERIWALPVVSGCDFYDRYKSEQGSGGGGGDDPSQSLVPPDPDSAPAPAGGLNTFINSCQSDYANMFTNVINNTHPHQIITVKASGSSATLSCYEVDPDTNDWVVAVVNGTTMSNLAAMVGVNGVHPINEIRENSYANRTPAGAWRLGNWSTCSDDIGAFGNDVPAQIGSGINYKKLTNTMYWIDGSNNQPVNFPSWYNTFYDTSQNYHLIQWKRDDWGSIQVWNSNGSVTYNTNEVEFSPGKYYSNIALNLQYLRKEHLMDDASESYRHAVVIRFNMIPHVTKPIKPADGLGAGSAYFLHSFKNDSNPTATGGCVSVHDDNMKLILAWLDRNKSPFIFIGL